MRKKRNRHHLFTIIVGTIAAGVLLALASSHSLLAESDVTVGVTVVQAPPSVGATILDPVNQQVFNDVQTITVSGTCSPSTYVVVDSNGSSVGTTTCALDGTFALPVQPFPGTNVLTALNYDDLNAPGPATPSVTITYTPPQSPVNTHPQTKPPYVNLPSNPSVVPGVPPNLPGLSQTNTSCNYYSAPAAVTGGQTRLAIVCIPRITYLHAKILIGVYIYGGAPPYHVTLSWGNDVESTYTSATAGYHTFAMQYESAGSYVLTARAIDASGNEALSQASIHIIGGSTPAVIPLRKVPWYESGVFWEIIIAIGLFIIIILQILHHRKRS